MNSHLEKIIKNKKLSLKKVLLEMLSNNKHVMPLRCRKKEGAPLIQSVLYYKPSDCLFQTTPTPAANGENEFLPPTKPFSFEKAEVRSLKHVLVPACD